MDRIQKRCLVNKFLGLKIFDAVVEWLVEGNKLHCRMMYVPGLCVAGKTSLAKEVYNGTADKKQCHDRDSVSA